ncbi:MAG: uroporphyrinogen decarboxylase family protein [Acidobacteriota bacterium]
MMNKRERLEAAISGQRPDILPVAFWRHFPGDDQAPEDLAAATVAWQKRWDFDFVKVTPASNFQSRDLGLRDLWKGNEEGTRECVHRPIQATDDWRRLPILDAHAGALGDQLRCLARIVESLPGTPVIQTVFSPLAQAKHLAGDRHLVDMRQSPVDFRKGLESLTESTVAFVRAIRDTGAAGIFYAVQHPTARLVSQDEFREAGREYDLRVLDAARNLWLNVLHLHGEDIYFDLTNDYPVRVWNWHDRETPPSLQQGISKINGAACGGLSRDTVMHRGTPELVRAEVADAIAQTGGRRLIVGTGCVTMITTPEANIRAAAGAARGFAC